MKFKFDMEFTGLHKGTTLVSLGIVAHNGETFYAEFTDYDQNQINDWIQENVIDNLSKDKKDLKTFANITIKDNQYVISHALMGWLESFHCNIEFVSDVCHYDFILLIDLLAGNALDMPEFISPVCHDINYDIASYFGLTETQAFDKNREEILDYFITKVDGNKHNAIYDARVIALIDHLINLTRERP